MTFYNYMRYYLLSYVCGCLVGFFSQEFEKTLGKLFSYTEEADVFSSSLWVSLLEQNLMVFTLRFSEICKDPEYTIILHAKIFFMF